MQSRRASIKETGEELSRADWERFDAGVAEDRAERRDGGRTIPEEPTRLPETEQDAPND